MKPAYRGQVFWHGWGPDPSKTGRIVRRGTLRHEVQWDDVPQGKVVMVSPDCLMLVSGYPNCCAYCKSREEAS